MTRLERIRLSKREQQTAQWIGTPYVLSAKLLILVLWRMKRWLMIFSLAFFVAYGYSNISASASEDKVILDHPVATPTPTPTPTPETSEREKVKAYICEVFGDQCANAFKILACENRSLNPNAQGTNKDGSVDTGIFQVNSFWANPAVLKDWKTNVDMAHVIYLRDGWNEWACESVWHALERNDTI